MSPRAVGLGAVGRRGFLAGRTGTRFQTREEVDAVIVGSGAAGGVMARELARAGWSVVVLEQGAYRTAADANHDEWDTWFDMELIGRGDPQRFRPDADTEPRDWSELPPATYARTVGGSSAHFAGNYWRFRPLDFQERSLLGPMAGTGFADWPIDYDELEPYYTRVDWEVGVSGVPVHGDPPRSRGYPHPPLPVKSSGVLFERGCRAMGLPVSPSPLAILSEPRPGRAPCVQCGACSGYICEMGAKSSSLATMIPEAEATGRCEIRAGSTVHRIETDASGRATEVVYFDADGTEQAQRARVVVVCANGAETPRLLLMSESSRHPQGLANGSGYVGRNLMYNGYASVRGAFSEPLNEFKGVTATRLCMEWYASDPARGFYGGGGLDARFTPNEPVIFALVGMPQEIPGWGAEFRRGLAHLYTRSMDVAVHSTSLPLATNTITLDPARTDRFGRPGIMVTYMDHDDDLATMRFLQDRGAEILDAAGAHTIWKTPVVPQTIGFHLLGTARMGDDPDASVVDRYHRAHEVPNLVVCDGSSLVTGGRGQPTMTIQALAFRAAEHLVDAGRRGEV
ncbi:MAG: GMC family oxidoreductase [Longimicrobiales bacterium]